MSASAKIDFQVEDVFAALDQAEISYCLLRGYEELAVPEICKEIDLLVAKQQFERLTQTLVRHGFVALPSWGHAPHHFFVSYDRDTGAWLKLDVVTELRYGSPIRTLRVNLAEAGLARRYYCEPVYLLAPADEFIALLLHCLLDKRNFRPARANRLLELQTQISQDQDAIRRLGSHVENYLEPALDVNGLLNALESQDWSQLLQARGKVAAQLRRRQPITSTWRTLSAHLARRIRPLRFAIQRRGVMIALLAPDGAGKSTLAGEMRKDPILRAKLIYMGTNVEASTIGLPTTRWLHRQLKAKGRQKKVPLPVKVMLKPLSFCNRIAELWFRFLMVRYHKLLGRVVICDRYVYDSWINNKASTPSKRLRRALLELGWPRPNLVLLLDAPGELLFSRKGEHSPQWLEQQRSSYLALKQRLLQMRVVDAAQSAEEVKREVTALVWSTYAHQQDDQRT